MMKKLTTSNLILTPPSLEDFSAINDFDARNKNHLTKWESVNHESVYQRLENWIKECDKGQAVRFTIKLKTTPEIIVGFCNFTQIFHGPFQACYLGYKIDREVEGKGLMFEALQASIEYVFAELGLHRIMANYLPINVRSAKLLDRLGFIIEGYAKKYLLINNKWEDHVLAALSHEQWFEIQNRRNSMEDQSNNHDLTFREVKIDDTSSLVSLMKQLGYQIDENHMRDNVKNYILLSNQKAWVVEKSGQVLGCIAVVLTNHFHLPAPFLRVVTMVVDEKHRGLGLGKKLMSIAEKFALEEGCSQVELTSGMNRAGLGTHHFYRSLGYIDLNDTKKYFAKKLSEK